MILKDHWEKKWIEKIKFDSISEEKLQSLNKANHTNLIKIAIENSDAVIKGSEDLPNDILEHIKLSGTPALDYQPFDDFTEAYSNFYLTKVL